MSDVALSSFRQEVRAVLDASLCRRATRRSLQVLGSGDGPEVLEQGRAYLRALAPSGLGTPSWPTEFGGAGLTPAQAVVLREELEAYEVPDLYPFSIGIGMAGPILIAYGSAGQQQRWLERIRTAEEIWCQMFSEPDAGSDLAALSTRAVRDGDDWVVTGQKVWTSRAHYSRWGLLLARSDPSAPKHRGITAFAVDMAAPNIELRPLRQMNGDEHFNEVFLDGVRVPDAYRIGPVGEGWRVAMTTLSHERSFAGAESSAISVADVIELVRSSDRRRDPVVRQQAARLVSEIESARYDRLRRQAQLQAGSAPGPEGSFGKLRSAALYKSLAELAMSVRGAHGMVGGDVWHTLVLTAPSTSIRGGTDEIQRNIVAERVLGLPAEPRSDRSSPPSGRADGR